MPASASARPRVLIADDSSFMRRLLAQALRDHGFDVVGQASDGDEALELYRGLQPDAMTLDLAMPGMDGIGVLRALRDQEPLAALPVVVVSAFSPLHGARAVDALAEGAFDLVSKPGIGESFDVFAIALRDKLQAASALRVPREAPRVAAPSRPNAAVERGTAEKRAVMFAVSTGGPRALAAVVPALPAQLGLGGVIVQHMPEGFTASLASRLDRASRIAVREAVDGDRIDASALLVAPGGSHVRLEQGGQVRLSDEPPIGGLRPRADLTIEDAARLYGERLLLVVMTGMGADGLLGARAVRAAGGRVIAEAEETCTVYGMPRAVVEARMVDDVVPLGELAEAIAMGAGA